ncbi:MAG TPA: tetratricopeptide repeat protein [Methylomirabilota bacterium]|jgi:TolA-binding protein
MERRSRRWTAFAASLFVALSAVPAVALDEPDRLWLVGERAMADGLTPLARRTLERFVASYGQDRRVPEALLLLGRARLAMGEADAALDAFRRAQTFSPPPGRPQEAKFWEGEALFRLKKYAEAGAAYDTVLRADAASPMAPEAMYGFAWTEQEQGRPETAVKAYQDLLQAWPEHALAPSAIFYEARALADLKRYKEAQTLVEGFAKKYPGHKLGPDARFLLGWTRIQNNEARAGVTDLQAFVAANPGHPDASEAQKLITQTLTQHGDRGELQEVYKQLMAQSPATPEGLYDAASIAGKLGRPLDQQAAWRKLRTDFPDHALSQRAALDLANSAYKRKEWREVVSQAQPATKSDEDVVRAEAWLLTGEAELKLKRFSPAVRAFESAVGVKNADASVRYRAQAGLGLAHEEQQQWKPALAAYEQAGKSPDPTLRNWARERATSVRARLTPATGDKKPKSGS